MFLLFKVPLRLLWSGNRQSWNCCCFGVCSRSLTLAIQSEALHSKFSFVTYNWQIKSRVSGISLMNHFFCYRSSGTASTGYYPLDTSQSFRNTILSLNGTSSSIRNTSSWLTGSLYPQDSILPEWPLKTCEFEKLSLRLNRTWHRISLQPDLRWPEPGQAAQSHPLSPALFWCC